MRTSKDILVKYRGPAYGNESGTGQVLARYWSGTGLVQGTNCIRNDGISIFLLFNAVINTNSFNAVTN